MGVGSAVSGFLSAMVNGLGPYIAFIILGAIIPYILVKVASKTDSVGVSGIMVFVAGMVALFSPVCIPIISDDYMGFLGDIWGGSFGKIPGL